MSFSRPATRIWRSRAISGPLPLRRFAPRATALAALAAALVGLAAGLVVLFTPLLAGFEQDSLSARFKLRGSSPLAGFTIVAIDDRTFAALDHNWPLPRAWDGEVLRRLHAAGAKTVFYDVQFTEPTTPSQDNALITSLADTGGAVLATTETDGFGHTNVLGGDALLRQLHSRAAAANVMLDRDGVVERMPYAFDNLPTVAIVTAQRLHARLPRPSLFGRGGAYIDYQGPPGSTPTLSFSDVLRGHFDPALVRGRIVVIGATAPTLEDLHPTPVDNGQLMTGPEIQASQIWTVLNGLPLRGASGLLGVLLVLLASALPPLLRLRRGVLVVAAAALGGAIALLAGDQLAFDGGTVLPVLAPLAGLAAATVSTLLGSHVLVTAELRATQLEIVHRLGRAAESRDGETGRHLERMALMCERLGQAAGLRRREAKLLRRASELHDVGKIAVPDEVLLKSGRFDQREREIMSTHAAAGARMLSGSQTSLIQMAEIIALTHHERWDGHGYPHGLAGEDIPLAGRICAICDVFDALISRRRYKDRWTLEETLTEIAQGAGSHFDPELVTIFLRIAPRLYRELVSRVDPDIAVQAAVERPPDHNHPVGGPDADAEEAAVLAQVEAELREEPGYGGAGPAAATAPWAPAARP